MTSDVRPRAPRTASAPQEPARTLADRWRELPPLLRNGLVALLGFAVVIAATSVTGNLADLRIASVGYFMLAVAGLQLLIGSSGQVSLGHGAFMLIGAYSMALLVLYQPMLPLATNLLIILVVSCVAGILVGAATARLHGPYLAGATLILAVGLPALTHRYHDLLGGSNGLRFRTGGAPPFLSGLVSNSQWQAIVVWGTALIALVVLATIAGGRLGRRMRAIRDDETAAALAGIPVGRTKVIAFVISAAAGGLAGGLQAYLLGTATPSSYTLALSLSLLAALVLGGLGSMWGALWAALALVYFEIWGRDIARAFDLGTNVANNLPIVFFGVVLILIIRLWPMGIHGAFQHLYGRLVTRRTSSTPQ